MTSETSMTAADAPAANGHGETHSTASLGALIIGSIGVVYGDIGTSPLYAFREAVTAANTKAEVLEPFAVLGVVSLILWALINVRSGRAAA
jgi:KUP system potassium uptake protein